MLGVRRWVGRTAAGLVGLIVLCALPGCQIIAGDECKDASGHIADGQSSHGVTPSEVVAPLIGDHPATLTWSLTGTVMPALRQAMTGKRACSLNQVAQLDIGREVHAKAIGGQGFELAPTRRR
ncbi:MAG TPA: hypothetical protein VNW92_14115 [Polyangiaceae bacterium]|jgi:hypothetical protein|nr:hypothetical protein [Polyangiaceae bacterium]